MATPLPPHEPPLAYPQSQEPQSLDSRFRTEPFGASAAPGVAASPSASASASASSNGTRRPWRMLLAGLIAVGVGFLAIAAAVLFAMTASSRLPEPLAGGVVAADPTKSTRVALHNLTLEPGTQYAVYSDPALFAVEVGWGKDPTRPDRAVHEAAGLPTRSIGGKELEPVGVFTPPDAGPWGIAVASPTLKSDIMIAVYEFSGTQREEFDRDIVAMAAFLLIAISGLLVGIPLSIAGAVRRARARPSARLAG